jgi:hypothetical protein
VRARLLIVLRAGRGSIHESWRPVCAGRVDVAISLYDDTPVDPAAFVAVHRAPGGKYRGLAAFFVEHANLVASYTHVWLFEDDLYLPLDSLLVTQETIARHRLVLAAPALAPESFASWPITVRNESFALRFTVFVEIMAPIMSRDFLARALPHFIEGHTGWGFEWLWRTFLDEMGAHAAILDDAPVVHTRPVGGGALYQGEDHIQRGVRDAAALFDKFGIDHKARPFRNLYGLARGNEVPLFGADFTEAALRGYDSLARLNPELHRRCLDFLRGSPSPLGG